MSDRSDKEVPCPGEDGGVRTYLSWLCRCPELVVGGGEAPLGVRGRKPRCRNSILSLAGAAVVDRAVRACVRRRARRAASPAHRFAVFLRTRGSAITSAVGGSRRPERWWATSRGWNGTGWCSWTSIPKWSASPRSRSGCSSPRRRARPRSHGSALVLDGRSLDRVKPRDQGACDATREACSALGWHYEVTGGPPESLPANVRWLVGYRHPRHHLPDGAERVGDPIAVSPVLFHLLWCHELHTDLDRPLHPDVVVTTGAVSA